MATELPSSPTPAALSPLQQEQEPAPVHQGQEPVLSHPHPVQEDNDWHGLGWRGALSAAAAPPASILEQSLQQPSDATAFSRAVSAAAALSPLQQEQEPVLSHVHPVQEDNDWHGLGWRGAVSAAAAPPASILEQSLQQPSDATAFSRAVSAAAALSPLQQEQEPAPVHQGQEPVLSHAHPVQEDNDWHGLG
jgi:hypothetical protein